MEPSFETIETYGVPIKAWTRGVPFDERAREQVRRIAEMPFVHRHVAVMPDVHVGIGATVGSVIATKGAVIPAAVGVDIGCGMQAARTTLKAAQLPDSLAALRSCIEKAVLQGVRSGRGNGGGWSAAKGVALRWAKLAERGKRFTDQVRTKPQRAEQQLGTLGGGNHFVELCIDEADAVWIMLHSGSRGVGNAIGTHYIEKAG